MDGGKKEPMSFRLFKKRWNMDSLGGRSEKMTNGQTKGNKSILR